MMGKWSIPPNVVRIMSFKSIMKRMRIHLCAKICTRCNRCKSDWEVDDGSKVTIAKCDNRRIGYQTFDGTITITSRGIPHDCPYLVEYLMIAEEKKEERKGKPLWKRVQDVIKERKLSKKK